MLLTQRFRPACFAVALLAGTLAACSDAPTDANPSAGEDLRAKVVALGFRPDMIVDQGSYFQVEGDIRINKSDLRGSAVRLPASGIPDPRFQYTSTALVSAANVHTIVVDLSGLATDTSWQNAARDALTQWNGVPGSYVKMVEGSPANITVTFAVLDPGVVGLGSFPSNGATGATIQIDRYKWFNGAPLPYSAKLRNMVHELGHTIGFRHTNWNQVDCSNGCGNNAGSVGANHVSGTPTSGGDANSVMNGATATQTWIGFSSNDQLAVARVYPLPSPTGLTLTHPSGTVQLSWNAVAGATGYQVQRVEVSHDENAYESWYNVYTYEGGWTDVYDTSVDTGSTWTGSWMCIWYQSAYEQQYSEYYWTVRAVFPNGYSATLASIPADDGPC